MVSSDQVAEKASFPTGNAEGDTAGIGAGTGVARRNLMRHWFRDTVRILAVVLVDVAVVLAVGALTRMAADGGVVGAAGRTAGWVGTAPVLGGPIFLAVLVLSLLLGGAYGPGGRTRDVSCLFKGSALAAGLGLLYGRTWSGPLTLGVIWWLVLAGGLTVALAVGRGAAIRVLAGITPRVLRRRIIVVVSGRGELPNRHHVGGEVLGGQAKEVVVGVVVAGSEAGGGAGLLPDLGRLVVERRADGLVVTGYLREEDLFDVLDVARLYGCELLATSRVSEVAWVDGHRALTGARSLVLLHAPALMAWRLAFKRIIDLVASFLGLVLLSPLLGLVALCVKLDSRGPPIFAQERVGRWGRTFKCYKFRSMRHDAEEVLRSAPELYALYVRHNYKLPQELDPRLTRVGRLLRKYSLDELPQLFNVLLGQMSLVGPRPIVKEELRHYGRWAPVFLSVKPGITGSWAVSGRSDVAYPERVALELGYVRSWSLSRDIGILWRTIPVVLGTRGAH